MAQGRGLQFQGVQGQSRADRLDGEQGRAESQRCHGRKRAMGETHQRIGRTGCQIRHERQEGQSIQRRRSPEERKYRQASPVHQGGSAQPRHAHRHQRRHGADGLGAGRLRDYRLPEGNRCEARRPAARPEGPDRQQTRRNLPHD